jgi:hypothetical protein
MFGPGAQLTQQVGSALAIPGVTALDSVAHSQIGSRQSGAAFGARISRDLNRWFNLEFSADWNASPLSINDKTLLGVEATRTSFLNFFSGPAFNFFRGGCRCETQPGQPALLDRCSECEPED